MSRADTTRGTGTEVIVGILAVLRSAAIRQVMQLARGLVKLVPNKARAFIGLTLLTGFSILAFSLSHSQWTDAPRFVCYLLLALFASRLRVRLPRINATLSVIFLLVLIGMQELSLAQVLVIGCVGSLVQRLWKAEIRPTLVQVLIDVASMTTSCAATYCVFHSWLSVLVNHNLPVMLALAGTVFFLTNTIPVAYLVSLTEGKRLQRVWDECYFWFFPHYLVGAAIAGLVSLVNRYVSWQVSLLAVPVIVAIYRSYRLYPARLEAERKHAEEIAALHLRTIEALALAIEAKDHTTHSHIRRVQIYAVEVGKELGLSDQELEALRAAAVLHDIGKLAVPEHIICKPGRLTSEEYEKMKIHPVVGAEILERVQFPYPVVPIVHAHHESWDGTGYPQGLTTEEIPLGARILSAVDCLDALASDRQYRRALPIDEAMKVVASEAWKSFDPRVVEVLQRRYVELEQMARACSIERARLSTNLKIQNGKPPASGLECSGVSGGPVQSNPVDFLDSIAAAGQEAQMLFELSQNLGSSLRLDETLSVLAVRLKHLIAYDSIAIYRLKDGRLIPEHVSGDDFRLLSSLQVPMGEGVSGWVAANRKPILNGNPSVEPGYLSDPAKFSTLRSVLAVPLEGVSVVVGVLALYRAEPDAFTRDHLRILQVISSKVGLSVENSLKYHMAESSATTDYLTGLPNARSLFVHLDSELARCQRSETPLAVVVCDLNGFKQVNDRLGHLEGNRVLRVFARKLKEDCREYDYVARMGGDEFVLVLPGLMREIVSQRLHRLHRLATEAGREVCGTDLLSLSAGHSFYLEDGTDAEQLLAEADRRMFAAKRLRHDDSYTPITEPVRVSARRPRARRGRATSDPNRKLSPTTAVHVHQAYPSTFVQFRRLSLNWN